MSDKRTMFKGSEMPAQAAAFAIPATIWSSARNTNLFAGSGSRFGSQASPPHQQTAAPATPRNSQVLSSADGFRAYETPPVQHPGGLAGHFIFADNKLDQQLNTNGGFQLDGTETNKWFRPWDPWDPCSPARIMMNLQLLGNDSPAVRDAAQQELRDAVWACPWIVVPIVQFGASSPDAEIAARSREIMAAWDEWWKGYEDWLEWLRNVPCLNQRRRIWLAYDAVVAGLVDKSDLAKEIKTMQSDPELRRCLSAYELQMFSDAEDFFDGKTKPPPAFPITKDPGVEVLKAMESAGMKREDDTAGNTGTEPPLPHPKRD